MVNFHFILTCCLNIYELLFIYSMASRPKRKSKSSTPSADNAVSSAPSTMLLPGPQLETMVQKCIARILPTIEDTFRQYMNDFYHQSRPETRTENSVQNSSLPNVPIASSATSSASSQ